MSVNTYGLKISNLRDFARETKTLTGKYGPYYHLSYDLMVGKLRYTYFVSSSRSYVRYDDENIIEIGYVDEPMTMQAVADMVHRRVEEYKYFKNNMA